KQMILDEWQDLVKTKQIDIAVLDMPLLNTMKYKDLDGLETLISDLILQLLSYMAEDERTRTRERQEEGIRIAKQNGERIGRTKHESDGTFKAVYPEWKDKIITAVEAMNRAGMRSNTFHRGVKEFDATL